MTKRLVVVVIAADGTMTVYAPRNRLFASIVGATRWAENEFGSPGNSAIDWSVQAVLPTDE